MGQVSVVSMILINVEFMVIFDVLVDYEIVCFKILFLYYSEYQVFEGGKGWGIVVKWWLQVMQLCVCDVQVNVDVVGYIVIEKDMNLFMVINWMVVFVGFGFSVMVKIIWIGVGGVKGFFEKIFVLLGLKKIQVEVLFNFKIEFEGDV